jgi:hypothetical protein
MKNIIFQQSQTPERLASEYKTRSGYLDLFLTRDTRYEQYTNYEWLIELKYLKEADRRRLEEAKKAGMAQLAGYGESERVKYGFKGGQVKKYF